MIPFYCYYGWQTQILSGGMDYYLRALDWEPGFMSLAVILTK